MLVDASKPCWACRKGRLICDFTKPACRKCLARGTECPGYDAKPLVWIPNGTVKAKRRKNDKTQPRAEPPKQQAEPQESTPASAPSKAVVEQPHRLLARPVKLAADLVILSHEIVEYLNVRISPNAVAASGDDPENPYRFPPEAASYLPYSMLYTLSCVALAHRIFQLEPGEHRKALTMRFQEHRGVAIRAISRGIEKGAHVNDETLFGVMAFLLSEVSGPESQTVRPRQSTDSEPDDERTTNLGTPSWRQHVDGAAAIIEMRGGLPELVVTRPSLKPLMTYFVVVDVMSGTTSPPLKPEKARRQLEILSVLPMLYGDGLLTTNPSPPELFALIIRINHLRSVLNTTAVPDAFMPSVMDLINQVSAFSPDIWAAKTTTSQVKSSSSSRIEELDAVPEPSQPGAARYAQSKEFLCWRRLATVYKSATALYCISSLVGSDTASSESQKPDPQELKRLFQRTLFQNLRELCVARETRSEQMRSLVLWPLAIAGTQLEQGQDQMKEMVRRELKWLSVKLGTLTPLVVMDFLERIWIRSPRKDPETHRTAWDAIFDRPYAFAV